MSAIRYTLSFDDATSVACEIDTERTGSFVDATAAPDWTRLEHQRCSHCPLSAQQHTHCPAALDIAKVVLCFAEAPSHKAVHVQVDMHERTHSRDTDLQTALHSVLGLMLSTSACPVLSRLRGLARQHVPFATLEETVFHMVGAHLIGQHLHTRPGEVPDRSLQGLVDLCAELQTVHHHLKLRLEALAGGDAHLNALVSLMTMTMLVGLSIEQKLGDMANCALSGPQPGTVPASGLSAANPPPAHKAPKTLGGRSADRPSPAAWPRAGSAPWALAPGA